MSYTPTSWSTGDTITAQAMNKIENGIANAGGGDFFVVTDSDGVLDKTWTEIYTALSNGMMVKRIYVDAGYVAKIDLLYSAIYDEEFYCVYPLGDTSFWYQTSTANGYPELQQD